MLFFSARPGKLAKRAALRWTEEIVLGRHGEEPGRLSLRLDVDLDDNPLLRHQLELGRCAGWDGPAVVGPNRAVGLILLTTTGLANGGRGAALVGNGRGLGRMGLEGQGVLVSAVGADLSGLRVCLNEAMRHCSAASGKMTGSANDGRAIYERQAGP